MTTLFISDLHLSHERRDIISLFENFLADTARRAEALYILGDLFDIWLGDDLSPNYYPTAVEALRRTTEADIPVHIMHGNRDFLIGQDFADATGCQLITDPIVIDLYGIPTVLTHGDLLCTDDVEYQAFRKHVRNPVAQQQFLALCPEDRIETAANYRAESLKRMGEKTEEIMDANQNAIETLMREHGVTQLIHGHTHRPGSHEFSLDKKSAKRIVLGDWYHQGSVLECDSRGCRVETLSIS